MIRCSYRSPHCQLTPNVFCLFVIPQSNFGDGIIRRQRYLANPGGLFGGLTTDNLLYSPPIYRNSLLTDAARQFWILRRRAGSRQSFRQGASPPLLTISLVPWSQGNSGNSPLSTHAANRGMPSQFDRTSSLEIKYPSYSMLSACPWPVQSRSGLFWILSRPARKAPRTAQISRLNRLGKLSRLIAR